MLNKPRILVVEDESGIANAFVPRPTFEKFRLTITQEQVLKIHGRLQNSKGVTSVYTYRATTNAAAPVRVEASGWVEGVGSVSEAVDLEAIT